MTQHKSWLTDLLLLTLAIGIFFAAFLGNRPLAVPDEARYSEIPREMAATGDYITPRLNYIKYFEKPPFFYWMQTVSIHWFGLSEWSMRFMTALMGLLGCLIIYAGTRKIYNRKTGLIASCLLATSPLYFVMSHFITIDMTLTTFLTACLLSFLLGVREPPSKKRNYYLWAMYVFSALATLTKGLVGIIFPGAIIFIWVLIFNEWRNLKYFCIPTGLLLWLAITLPWHILVQLRNPEFFDFYIIKQHLARYLTDYANREQPLWYLPVFLISGFFPWIIFLVQSVILQGKNLWRTRHQHKDTVFLWIWAIFIYLFFQISHSQLPPYVLPVLPPLAILTANYLAPSWERPLFHKSYKFIFTILIIFMSLFLFSLNFIYPSLEQKSIKPLILSIQKELKPDDEIISYHGYYQDLPFYTQRRVVIAGWGDDELEFGIQHQPMNGWYIDDKTLWQRWDGSKRLFLFMSQKDYNSLLGQSKMLYLWVKTPRNVVVSNKPRK